MEIVGSIFFDLNWEFNFLYKLATKVNKNVYFNSNSLKVYLNSYQEWNY